MKDQKARMCVIFRNTDKTKSSCGTSETGTGFVGNGKKHEGKQSLITELVWVMISKDDVRNHCSVSV
jgi:hypothetical protein